MRAYTIFDDFPQSAVKILEENGIEVTVHPVGVERPEGERLKQLVESYDIVIVGTGQNLTEPMFENVYGPRIIGTASAGMDHICVPEDKRQMVKVVNAPTSNRISVAEHTFALILVLEKRLADAVSVAKRGLKKKEMLFPPSDLYGKTIGVVGAGGTANAVLKMAQSFGLECMCWTPHPQRHKDLHNVEFVPLDEMLGKADVISVNIPLSSNTFNLIDRGRIDLMKKDAVFISLSRAEITDNKVLFSKAKEYPNFRVGLDVDADKVIGLWDVSMQNVIVTPHIGGGTVQSRIRLFEEISHNIISICKTVDRCINK